MWLFPEFPWGGRKMKTSRTEAAEARQRIVRAAADRFRRDGIAETGLAGFVPEAGLTAGGVYCPFGFEGNILWRGRVARAGTGRGRVFGTSARLWRRTTM